MRILIRRQKQAVDFVRVFWVVQVETHDRMPALHCFHQKTPGDYWHFAKAIAKIIDMLQFRLIARETPQ